MVRIGMVGTCCHSDTLFAAAFTMPISMRSRLSLHTRMANATELYGEAWAFCDNCKYPCIANLFSAYHRVYRAHLAKDWLNAITKHAYAKFKLVFFFFDLIHFYTKEIV